LVHEKKASRLRAREGWLSGLNPTVAIVSKSLVLVVVVFTVLMTDAASVAFSTLREGIVSTLKWYYIALVAFVLGFAIWLMMSRFGHIKLGRDDEKPEFSFFSWFAMLFGAGMGIGLVFWSVAEPLTHFESNPFLQNPGSPRAAEVAMRLTFFHWGLHPWAIYAVVGLALAYFSFRRGLPLTIRSTLYPLLGERIYGPWGHAIDILSIFATIFGVATSLGLGMQQVNTGLYVVGGWEVSISHQLILIGVVTSLAVISVATGLEVGIRRLSELNILLSVLVLAFVFIYGPTRLLVLGVMQSTGDYIQNVVWLSLWTDATLDTGWQGGWTTFYWGWWISWAPFVGMFIARISRGRTVREFVAGVLIVPTLITFIWFGIMGGTALHLELDQAADLITPVNEDMTLGIYAMFTALDSGAIGLIAAVLATLLIATFFVTSSDSGTLVINTIMSVGDPDPPISHRVIWGVSEGAVAAVLLIGGGLTALQAASISAALPFSVIMIFMMIALVNGLKSDPGARILVHPNEVRSPSPGE